MEGDVLGWLRLAAEVSDASHVLGVDDLDHEFAFTVRDGWRCVEDSLAGDGNPDAIRRQRDIANGQGAADKDLVERMGSQRIQTDRAVFRATNEEVVLGDKTSARPRHAGRATGSAPRPRRHCWTPDNRPR